MSSDIRLVQRRIEAGIRVQQRFSQRLKRDIPLNVPSKVTPRIQESRILIGHIICELVERAAKEDNK